MPRGGVWDVYACAVRTHGGPAKFDAEQKSKIYKLYSDGVYVSDFMKMFDASRPTIYKVINEMKPAS